MCEERLVFKDMHGVDAYKTFSCVSVRRYSVCIRLLCLASEPTPVRQRGAVPSLITGPNLDSTATTLSTIDGGVKEAKSSSLVLCSPLLLLVLSLSVHTICLDHYPLFFIIFTIHSLSIRLQSLDTPRSTIMDSRRPVTFIPGTVHLRATRLRRRLSLYLRVHACLYHHSIELTPLTFSPPRNISIPFVSVSHHRAYRFAPLLVSFTLSHRSRYACSYVFHL